MINSRVNLVIENMKKHGMKQTIISSTASIFYLTGEWIEPGERMLALYINENGNNKLFINELFPMEKDLGVELVIYNDTEDPVKKLAEVVEEGVLGIDKEWPSHFLIRLMSKKENMEFKIGSPAVDDARMLKDGNEIELMRKSSKINDAVMSEVVNLISEEYSETKVCKILNDLYTKHGAQGFSFHPLIAYGGNAAEPHHESDGTMLKKGDSVILDIGGRTNNYCSDMTRTVFYGEPKEEHKKIYNTVKEANLRAIAVVKPGVKFSDIDRAAREYIEEQGYGKYFTHRTGHNIGIDVHEAPDVSLTNDGFVEEGMTFSIEPGIYVPGECGVRIEDLVLVTKDGCEVLNNYSKELQIIK